MQRLLICLCGMLLSCGFFPAAAVAEDLHAIGKRVAEQHCARCHVVGEANRMGGIGSTPSFALLRRMDDWEERYGSFYARNPHPSFITVEGLSVERTLPPNAQPIDMTMGELDALMAYVTAMKTE